MKRVSIFIREDQFESLSRLSNSRNMPAAELIREAIDFKLLADFGLKPEEQVLEKTHGMLKERFQKGFSSEDIVSVMREEWDNRSERNK
jgi:hypothetical protein